MKAPTPEGTPPVSRPNGTVVFPVPLPPRTVHAGPRHWPLTDDPIGWRVGNTPIPFVVHVQETHNNLRSQENLSRLVAALARKHPDLLICAEGAWGRVPFEPFEGITDPVRRQKFADALLAEGLLTGEEHAVAAGHARRPLWGAEDPRLHAAHVLAQSNTRRFAPFFLPDLERRRSATTRRLDTALAPPLRDIRALKTARTAGRLDLTAYVAALMERVPPAERRTFERLTPLLTVRNARQATDAGNVPPGSPETDWTEVLNRVQSALTALADASPDETARDLRRLEQAAEERLWTKEPAAARAARTREKWLECLVGLWALTLTPDQWAEYKALRATSPNPLGARERSARRHAEAFYELAERRDAAMADRLGRLLRSSPAPVALLVTGGFHGRGIETRLENAGFNYGGLYLDSRPPRSTLRAASALVAPRPAQTERLSQIAERFLPSEEAARFRPTPGLWVALALGAVGLMFAGPALAVDVIGVFPGLAGDPSLWSMAGWAGTAVVLNDNERLLSWRSRLQDLFPRRRPTVPSPPDEGAVRSLAQELIALPLQERVLRTRKAIVESPAQAAAAVVALPEGDRRGLLDGLDPKFRGDLLHGLEEWARARHRRVLKSWLTLPERLRDLAAAPGIAGDDRKRAMENAVRDEIAAMRRVHRDLLTLRWAHASPIPKDRPALENPIVVAAGVLERAMANRQKLLDGLTEAANPNTLTAALAAHQSALRADGNEFLTQIHALDADRLNSPLVPRDYLGWSEVVARLGADPLKPDFLTRPEENGDVLAAAKAGDEIQSAIEAGWLDIVPLDPRPDEKSSPFDESLNVWTAHALHPTPSKWGLAVWPNDLTKMNFAGPLASRLAAEDRPRRVYHLRTARLFGDHTRQTEVSKALAQLMKHLSDQGHAVLLMDLDIYQTEKQDVLQRVMNEWKKLPTPPSVIGVCTELTHKMRLETKTRDLFDPVISTDNSTAIDEQTLAERFDLLTARLRFRFEPGTAAARTLLERARAFTGFARGDFAARWLDRAVVKAWRRLLRVRESADPFELTDDDLETVLRDRPPEHLRPLRDRIADVLPRLSEAQRGDLLREFNDMANPALSRQEAQKIRLWIEEFIEIHSLPAAPPVLGGADAAQGAPALYQRVQGVFARSHFGMDAVVRQVEGILTKILQSERRNIVPEADYTCLIGPPGVGKTSILLLIGEALDRPVKIISGTKIQTEEDLKGFLRTYVNSHSGELAAALRSGAPEERVRNPIVVIDEVDKIPPAIQAILLQVLDAAQNNRFEDFYLGEIDLSGVEFVLTGNDAGRIIEPLKNRMHIEHLKGYTEAEKIQIATRFMLPKLLAEFGLAHALRFPHAGDTVAHLVRGHDREQGVRELERLLERVVLFAGKRWVLGGRRAPVDVDTALIDASLKTPTRPRLPLPDRDTVGLAHFSAANGFAFAVETLPDGPAAAGAPRLPATGDAQTAPALKEILDLAGRLVAPTQPAAWVIAAPRSGTPPDPAAGLAAAISLASAASGQAVKRDSVFLGALDNRGRLLSVPDLDRRLFGAIDAGASEIVLPLAQWTEARFLAGSVVGLRGPLFLPRADGTAALFIPRPGPGLFGPTPDSPWVPFEEGSRQRPDFRSDTEGFLRFEGPAADLRDLARRALDAAPDSQTLYVLVDRWSDALGQAFRATGEAPRARKTVTYDDDVRVRPPENDGGGGSGAAGGTAESFVGEVDRAMLFHHDNYRKAMISKPPRQVAEDLFETVVDNYKPAQIPSAEGVLQAALVYNPAIAAHFFIRLIDLWKTGEAMTPDQRRAVTEILGTLSPDTVGALLLASAQYGANTLIQSVQGSADDLLEALTAPGDKKAALATLDNLRAAFQERGAEGDLPHPIDELARRLGDWDPNRSPAAPADLAALAESVALRVKLFADDLEQAQRAPLAGEMKTAHSDLKQQLPDEAHQPVQEIYELNNRGRDALSETLRVYAAGRLLEDMTDTGFATEHRPRAPLSDPDDELLDPVLRGAARAVADQATASALRHTVLLSCPDALRPALPDYLSRFLWREGLPRRVLRLNTLNLQMPNTEFADDTAFAWRRMQRVIQSAARQGNCLLVIDLDEFTKNVPPSRHAIDMGRILAVANDSPKPLPLVFLGSEAAHLRFQETVTAYGDQVVAHSLADASPAAVIRAQVGRVERARGRPVLATGVVERVIQQIRDRALGLRGAQRVIDRLSAGAAPADLADFERARERMDNEDRAGSKDLSIEQRFERESYRLPPAVRAQSEKFLGLWVASTGDEAAKLEHRLRLILDFPYPRVPTAEQKYRDAQTLLGDLPETLRRLRETLDAEFYGMDEVKDRIEDFVTRTLLARAAGSPPRGKGLLLVGPPGTAKTTIVLAISEALGIPMTVVPCGAVKDAQYFVGFDSGFLGSKTGKLCEAAIRMGVPNGIYLLDEIEKMRPNENGQHPGDVFLQILDPKQNTRVREKFLGVDTDYSQNLFIATANGLDGVPAPLLDRFDVVSLSGYNKSAKKAIGLKLVRRLMQKWRIEDDVRTPDLPGVIDVAVEKTHALEKGVRQLGKTLNAVYKTALTEKFKRGLDTPIEVTPDFARRALRLAPAATGDERPLWAIGRVQGLAVLSGEGEEGRVLDIEADLLPAPRSDAPITVVAAGRAQGLMVFSLQTALPAALGWLERAGGPRADAFRGKLLSLLVLPWHIPKDGDSAGTAFTLALISALTGRPLRQDFAITGAISRGGRLQLVGGIPDKMTKAQQVAKTIFLPRENENDLLTHLLKSPDQIHFVEARRPGGDWERTLYVIPRAFINAGLPFSAVEDYVRDAKNAGLTVVHDPALKSNEWIKVTGTPVAIDNFFQAHRGVLETPPLHVLADRVEDVTDRVLGDEKDLPPGNAPPTPVDPGPSPLPASNEAAGAAVWTQAPVQTAFNGAVIAAAAPFAPLRHAESAVARVTEASSGDRRADVLAALSALNALVIQARPDWAEDIKGLWGRWDPENPRTGRALHEVTEKIESAVFSLRHRDLQNKARKSLTALTDGSNERPRPEARAVPVLALDWNSVITAEGAGLTGLADSFLTHSPEARLVLAGNASQKSTMEKSVRTGALAVHHARILILDTLPETGAVDTEKVKDWVRERLRATGLLGEGDMRFRLGATPAQAQRWTGLLQSLLVFAREVVVPADVWKTMKPHLQGDLGVDNPDGSHTLPAREYSLADLLKNIAQDLIIQTQA